MKAVFPLLLSLLLAVHGYAGPRAAINTLAGIPLGSGSAQVVTVMAQRGAAFQPDKSTPSHLKFERGTFDNQNAFAWVFTYQDSKLSQAEVVLQPGRDKAVDTFRNYVKTITAKYGQPFSQTSVNMQPDELLDLLASGKLHLRTVWIDPADGRSLSCSIWGEPGQPVLIRIGTHDDKVSAELQDAEQSDL